MDVPFKFPRRRPDKSSVYVIGGGLSGLIVADVMKARGAKVTIVETQQSKEDFFFGSRIYKTKEAVEMLERFDLAFSDFIVRGGIMLRGFVWPYPMCFKGMSEDQAERVNQDHFEKAVQTASGEWGTDAMSREPGTKQKRALRCNVDELTKRLKRNTRRMRGTVKQINGRSIVIGAKTFEPDFVAITLPLWEVQDLVPWHVPDATALRLNVAFVVPRRNRFQKWDFVFTPYTPGGSVFRVSQIGNGFACEFNGRVDTEKLISDLNFIFPDGFSVAGVKYDLTGHLFPLQHLPEWPWNVSPIGRVAEWRQMTIDDVVQSAHRVAKEWFL